MENISIEDIGQIATIVVTACAAIAAITPTKVDDNAMGKLGKIYNVFSRAINWGGLNVIKAKNADDK